MKVRTRRVEIALLLGLSLLVALPILGVSSQTAAAQAAEVAVEAPAEDAEAGDKTPDGDDASKSEGEDLVAVNLNNVGIDQVISFLGDITGKFIVKHKDVTAQIMVYSPEKVTKQQAFSLICDALLLEKVAVVETDDTINLLPTALVPELMGDLVPVAGAESSAGIVKRAIPLKFATVKELETVIKPLLSKTGVLIAHPGSKKLIVTDTANRVNNIESVIQQFDVLDLDQSQVQIFTLEHADAETLAPILKSVLTVLALKQDGASPQGGKPGQPGRPPQQPQKPGQPGAMPSVKLDVVPYKTANWIVVVASKEVLAAAQPLVEELDRERPPELTLRILPVQFADSADVADKLANLFQKRPEKRLKETVEITAHDRSNSLLILSSESNYEIVKRIVGELDTEDSVKLLTESYELKYADAEDIAEQMNDLYSGMQQNSYRSYYYYSSSRSQTDKTRFVPETRTNSIIAIARPTEFKKIEELLTQLDVPIDTEQAAPRIYKVRYVDAKEMADVLNEIFGAEDSGSSGGYYDYWYGYGSGSDSEEVGRLYGKVKFVPETSTNSIIVTTNNKENYSVIESFIEELDRFNPEAANTMVVRLQNAKAEDIADQLNSLFAREGARAPQNQQQEEQRSSYYAWLNAGQRQKEEREVSNLIGQVRVVPDTRTNSLTITTAGQNFELLRSLIDELDIESPKVLVRVRLIEVTTTRASRIGTRYSSDASVFEADDFDNGFSTAFGFSWAELRGLSSLDAGTDIGVLVQFLQRNLDTRILSEPTLVMNNNEAADIFVGSRIPFITNSQSTPEGTLNQSFEYKDAGTTLKITPNINELDKVVMKVELESSQIRPGEVLFGGYIIDTRQFNTEVAVNSGETVVVGGILRESESKAVRRVPVLGHIPVVNLAFRKRDKKHETTELIAFITPEVLRDSASTTEVTDRMVRRLDLVDGAFDLDSGENGEIVVEPVE